MLNVMNKTSGIELGVQRAHFSVFTLDAWPKCERYYLVDVWQSQEKYNDLANVPQEKQDVIFAEAQANIAKANHASKAVFLRNLTSEAVKHIPGQVDYVYVDARHDYCGVMEDLQLYWPKVRSGGVMAGHDYVDAHRAADITNKWQSWEVCLDGTVNWGAVKGAVDDFFRPLGLPVFVTYQDVPWNSWIVLKP